MKKIIIIFLIFQFLSVLVFGQKSDSTFNNQLSLTLLPMLRPFTESHAKIIGLEYERNFTGKFSTAIHLDFGRFLDYKFYDYYGFFDPNYSPHYNLENVLIKGFHIKIIPRFQLYELSRVRFFTGLATDYHFYFLDVEVYNSESQETSYYEIYSNSVAIGIDFGLRVKITNRFFASANTSLYYTGLVKTQTNDYLSSKSGYWRSNNLMYWGEVFFQIGYKF